VKVMEAFSFRRFFAIVLISSATGSRGLADDRRAIRRVKIPRENSVDKFVRLIDYVGGQKKRFAGDQIQKRSMN
jgi:hypothetical protein